MTEVVIKKQFFISSKKAKSIGKMGMADILDKEMVALFNEIASAALNGEDDIFAVQWMISKLDKESSDAIKKECETGN